MLELDDLDDLYFLCFSFILSFLSLLRSLAFLLSILLSVEDDRSDGALFLLFLCSRLASSLSDLFLVFSFLFSPLRDLRFNSLLSERRRLFLSIRSLLRDLYFLSSRLLDRLRLSSLSFFSLRFMSLLLSLEDRFICLLRDLDLPLSSRLRPFLSSRPRLLL